MTETYVITIEFRYQGVPKNEIYSQHKSKTITLGVTNDFNEACEIGNKALEKFEERFKLNPNYMRKERFSRNGFLGRKNVLIGDLGYIKTPFTFFAKINTFKSGDVMETIDEVINDQKKYKEYKDSLN